MAICFKRNIAHEKDEIYIILYQGHMVFGNSAQLVCGKPCTMSYCCFLPFSFSSLSTDKNPRNCNLCFMSLSVRAENQHRKRTTEAFAHKLYFLHWIVSVSIHGYLSYIFHCLAIPTHLFHCSIMPSFVTGTTFIWFLHSFLIPLDFCFCLSYEYLFI